mmetsp:Transcript_124653/g.364039  ORF Transcript_124653/g.364039 Transcript_124653/m.364039 type:complete len:351 (+) Transcript_124653:84-1136(+)
MAMLTTVGAAVAVLLATCPSLTAGSRSEVRFEEAAWLGHYECTASQLSTLAARFEIGKQHGRTCANEAAWRDRLDYTHPTSRQEVAMYLYPRTGDHNDAFSFCANAAGRSFDKVACFRLLQDTEHLSVWFDRVDTIEDAMGIVRSLPQGVTIRHMVLGGHGSPTELEWGDARITPGQSKLAVDDPLTNELLDTLYSRLTTESIVFLDSCQNAKRVDGQKNMLQHVAHRLAGVTIYASKECFSSSDVRLKDVEDFPGKIILENGRDVTARTNYMVPELRKWLYMQNRACEDIPDKPVLSGQATLEGCYSQCAGNHACKAIVYYPAPNRACFISQECAHTAPRQGPLLFVKK